MNLQHTTYTCKYLNVFTFVAPFLNPHTLSTYSNILIFMWVPIEEPTTHYAHMQTFKCFYNFGPIHEHTCLADIPTF